MRIGLVGGGTGGHFYPLIAVAEELRAVTEQPELVYFGPSPYNREALVEQGIRYVSCPAGKVRRYTSALNVLDAFKTFFGIFVAIGKLYVYYPDVIFSKGGYTSVPILLAARVLRIPVVIHESDAVPGRANKLAKSFAKYIAIAHDEVAAQFPPERTALVGIPIRRALQTPDPDPFTTLGIPNDLPLIYITGGSLGAERLNNIVLRSLDDLLPYYRIFHQAGTANVEPLQLTAQTLITDPEQQSRYYLAGHISGAQVRALLSAASLVITRAGSTTLFEIAQFGKPSIVVPIPEDVSRDQRSNAYAYARNGAATVIEEQNLTEHILAQEVQRILVNPTVYSEMSQAAANLAQPDAAAKIAHILLRIGIEHGS